MHIINKYPDPKRPATPEEALLYLAKWFEFQFPDCEATEVEDDLRRFADEVAHLRTELDGYQNYTWPDGISEDAALACRRLYEENCILRAEVARWAPVVMTKHLADLAKSPEVVEAFSSLILDKVSEACTIKS